MIQSQYVKKKFALKLNKLAYVGMCILDLSKVLMYAVHYDYIDDLILVIVQLSESIMIIQTNQLLVKRKMKPAVLLLKNLLD